MRAIVIAAGRGVRLRPHTADRAKCMVELCGRPMLHHQIAAFERNGIDDVVVVRGYKRGTITAPGVRYAENPEYATNNILMSLFCAGPELVGDVVVSYGDIIYHPDALSLLLENHSPGALVVDTAWEATYEGRTDHPVEQAELCRVTPHGFVSRVGKQVPPGRGVMGEFIGLARFNSALVARLWGLYLDALAKGDHLPYGNASSLRKAYLTDIINAAVDGGDLFAAVPIEGRWREIDTVQDLERAQDIVDW